MTNLEIIKYLVYENPKRLASFLNEICYDAWDFGRLHQTRPITDWDEWLQADPKATWDFSPNEIEEWSQAINKPNIQITYPDNLVVELPFEGKDPNHMWNTDNNYNVINMPEKCLKELETGESQLLEWETT